MRRFAPLAALLLACQPSVPDDDPPTEAVTQAQAQAGRWVIPANVLQAAGQANVTITDAGPWRGEASCSGNFTRGAQRFKEWTLAHWPQVTSVGGYSCRAINGNGAVTSIHAVGRAVDIFIPLDGGQADNDLGDALANYLLVHADEIGVQRVIWDRTYWRAGNSPREGEYGGAHPHHDHLHVELSVDAANERTPFFQAGLPAPDRGPCGDPLPAAGGQVDDGDACFGAYGPAQYWRSEGGAGVGGDLLWTNAFGGANPSNWAMWRFRLRQAGEYTVQVHTVGAFSRFNAVRYEVVHAGGVASPVVNLANREGWTDLGTWRFQPDAEYSVKLFDNYSPDPGDDVHLTADAIRLRPAAAPPPPERDMAPPPPPRDMAPPPPEGDMAPPPPPRDQGPPPPPRDAAPLPDAAAGFDAFTPPRMDQGQGPRMPTPDAAPPHPDAGQAGKGFAKITGGCQAAPTPTLPLWGLALVLLGVRRRRRREPRSNPNTCNPRGFLKTEAERRDTARG